MTTLIIRPYVINDHQAYQAAITTSWVLWCLREHLELDEGAELVGLFSSIHEYEQRLDVCTDPRLRPMMVRGVALPETTGAW